MQGHKLALPFLYFTCIEMCKFVDLISRLHCEVTYVKAGVTGVFDAWNNKEKVKQHFSLLLFYPNIAKKKFIHNYTNKTIQTTARDGQDT